MLQVAEIAKLSLHIRPLFFQSPLHRREAIPRNLRSPRDLAELASESLHPAYKGQRLDVVLLMTTEASLRPRGPREQTRAFVETNRVNVQSDSFRNTANPLRLEDYTPGCRVWRYGRFCGHAEG